MSYDIAEENKESREELEKVLDRRKALMLTKSTYSLDCKDLAVLKRELLGATKKGDTVALVYSKGDKLVDEYVILSGETRKAVLPHRITAIVHEMEPEVAKNPLDAVKFRALVEELRAILGDQGRSRSK